MSFVHIWKPGASATPVVLALHGTGGNEHDLIPLVERLAPGWPVLSPRGKAMEGPMPRFFRRLAEGVFDLEDVAFRARELAEWVGWARVEYAFGDRPVIAVGYSNGANIAAATMLMSPDALAGAVLLRGMVPIVPEVRPNLAGKRMLMVNGRQDPIIPQQSAGDLQAMLMDYGADVTFEVYEGGHELSGFDLDAATRFLASHAS